MYSDLCICSELLTKISILKSYSLFLQWQNIVINVMANYLIYKWFTETSCKCTFDARYSSLLIIHLYNLKYSF
jgi:hypothetical protein